MHKIIKNIIFCTAITCSQLSYAGGPLVVGGLDGNTPVTYQNPNITLHLENGKLGTRSNAEADNLIQQAFDLWNGVNTTTINLTKDDSKITIDINIDNFDQFIPDIDGITFNADDGLNPIVYDDNGEIIDAFFGTGQSDSTIGFASSILFVGTNHFDEGFAVINGKDLGLSNTTFKLLIAHEIGHLIGLDHSQVDINNEEGNFIFCGTSDQSRYPVMYPFACRDDSSLHADDISAISALYPDVTAVNSSFGILNGFLTDNLGNPVLGANIWVEHNDGRTFSIVSDYLKHGTGFYELLLPPGNYTLHANSINTEFNAGSSIGPYALTPDSISFSCLGYLPATSYEGNTPGTAEVITISANQAQNINFKLSNVELGDCSMQKKQSSLNSSASKGSSATSPILLMTLGLFLAVRRFSNRA